MPLPTSDCILAIKNLFKKIKEISDGNHISGIYLSILSDYWSIKLYFANIQKPDLLSSEV